MTARVGDAAAQLMCECLPALGNVRTPLIVDDGSGLVAAALARAGCRPAIWVRSVLQGAGAEARPWVPDGRYDASLVRLPKAKDSLGFALDAVAAQLAPGAPIAVFGANVEGVRSAGKLLALVADNIETLATRHHARVLMGRRRTLIPSLKGCLQAWRQEREVEVGGVRRSWVSYPGTFAKGGVDQGTAFLLRHVPETPAPAYVLDFAAGTGVIAASLVNRFPRARIEMIDSDALAIAAARENVPGAFTSIGDCLAAGQGGPYDLIVSNPPIHDGIAESRRVLDQLIADAPHYLRPGGRLVIVVQRRVPVLGELKQAFGNAKMLADNGRFTIAMAELALQRHQPRASPP